MQHGSPKSRTDEAPAAPIIRPLGRLFFAGLCHGASTATAVTAVALFGAAIRAASLHQCLGEPTQLSFAFEGFGQLAGNRFECGINRAQEIKQQGPTVKKSLHVNQNGRQIPLDEDFATSLERLVSVLLEPRDQQLVLRSDTSKDRSVRFPWFCSGQNNPDFQAAGRPANDLAGAGIANRVRREEPADVPHGTESNQV